MPSLRGTAVPSTLTQTLSTPTQIVTSESQQTVVPTEVTSCAPQTVTSISFDLTSTGPMEEEGMRSSDQVPSMVVSLPNCRIHPCQLLGDGGVHIPL